MATIGAAPHLPAGIHAGASHGSRPSFGPPYSDGERAAPAKDFANHQRCGMDAIVAASLLLPVHGEKCPAGR